MPSAPAMKLSNHLGDNSRPARLVTGSHASAGAAVEVFIELEQIAPGGICLEQIHISVEGASPCFITPENANQTLFQFKGDLPEVQFTS